MNDLYKKELIRKFLDEELQGEEIDTFKTLFQTDPEFAREVKLATDTDIAFKTLSRIALQQRKEQLREPIPIQRYFLIAASIVIIVGLGGGGYWYFSNRYVISDRLFASYFKPPESFTRGIERGFEQQQPDTRSTQAERFHYSIYLIQKQEYNQAIEILAELIQEKPNLYPDQSEWYLALCYLKTKQLELAREHFEHLIADNTRFSSDATEIIRQLDRFKN